MSIAKFAVKNTVLLNILLAVILILGVFSVSRLPREQFAEVPFYWVNVVVPYPGASAEDIEKTVTIKVENELSGIDRLKRIQSVSSDGLSVVRVEFDDGINGDEFGRLFQEVKTRFGRIPLPDGTLQEIIDDFSSSDFLPVIEVVLWGDLEYSELYENATFLADRIRGVNQVSQVDLIGGRDRQVLVSADRARLESLGISIDEIIRAISDRNVTIPAGTITTDSREYLVRTVGEVSAATEIGDVIIRRDGTRADSMVRIADVSEISEGFDPKGVGARFGGREAISLRIAKVPGGSSVGVIDSVKEVVGAFEQEIPPDLRISLFNDSTIQIRDSISVLLNNALFGLILLVLILFVFIGFRNALMTALGIPVTFAITFIVLEALGQTFNTNTLFGLVLVLGLVVDHAIVITENGYRFLQQGLTKREAAIKGAKQVTVPVIAATATTVATFLPLMILPGTLGKFLRVIPLTVSIALIASTLEAIFFIPAHFAEWPGANGAKKGAKKKRPDLFQRFVPHYRSFLSKVYAKKGLAVIIMAVVVIGSFSLVPLIQQELFNAEDFTLFYVDIEMPIGTPQAKTDDTVQQFEEMLTPLIGQGEVEAIVSSIGLSQGSDSVATNGNVAQIIVDLSEKGATRTRSIEEIIEEVRDLTASIAGPESVKFRKAQSGPPTDAPVSFRLTGDDYNALGDIADSISERLSQETYITNVDSDLDKSVPELRIVLNPERASAYGLSAASVGRFLRSSFDGVKASTIFRNNEELNVLVKYDMGDTPSIAALEGLMIPAPGGRMVPFSSVAEIVPTEAIASIKRVDGKRQVTIVAEASDTSSVPALNGEIEEYFEANFASIYPGIELKVGGEFAEFQNLLGQILRIFIIGVFLIYLILGTQFKSYSQPFLILASIPFAFAGVVLYLVSSGTPFSTTVIYAAVALAGIAVNDAIVLISFINELRASGKSVKDSVIEAAGERLRPIILTSVTTIAGLLPTALGLGGKSVVWGPMASTIIFGLIFSTITALIVIPAMYGIFFGKKDKGIKSGSEVPPKSTAAEMQLQT